MKVWITVLIIASILCKSFSPVSAQPRPRLIVLTDISSIESGVREPDDAQAMIHLILYSNEFDIEGLIASSTLFHGYDVRPENINAIVDAYGKDRPNLLLHDKNYPKAERLRQVIKSGQPMAGTKIPVTESIGKGKDTEASDWIIKMVDKPDKNPLWILIWGGSADLAQALWKVKEKRTPKKIKEFIAKIRVLAGGDQDATGPWIKSNFPDLYYVTRGNSGRGVYRGGDTSLVRSAWVQRNIKGHGALGNLYPDYHGGDIWTRQLGKVYGIKSGDECLFLGLINNGLNERNHLIWENWGGRLEQDSANPHHYHDAIDSVGNYKTDVSPYLAAVYRWRPDFQADFQARLNWCVSPYNQANHAPIGEYERMIKEQVQSGRKVLLRAGKWSDPDDNSLMYNWQVVPEEGTYRGEVIIENASSASTYFLAPNVQSVHILHILLTVRDNGNPSLCRYQRFIFTIIPK